MSLCGFNCMFSLTVNTACAFWGQDLRFCKKNTTKKQKKTGYVSVQTDRQEEPMTLNLADTTL